MNIIKFQGGLGNQMFQYALYRKLRGIDCETYMDLSNYKETWEREFVLDKIFPNIVMNVVPSKILDNYLDKNSKRSILKKIFHRIFWGTGIIVHERENGMYDSRVFKLRNKIIDGYWQSEKYWEDISFVLREEFVFPAKKERALNNLVTQIKACDNSVSVHVRRGDYLDKFSIYGNICTPDYYKKAVEFINEKTKSSAPHFFVFSDDINWVKENMLLPNAVFVSKEIFEEYEDWYDMFLMSQCKYNILANSSFSWWGAWLNQNKNKIVVAPARWDNQGDTKDIWCKDWYKIG